LKQKLSRGDVDICAPMKVVKVAVVEKQKQQHLSDNDYSQFVSEMKNEVSKRVPDLEHLKELIMVTYINRRTLIKSKPSSQLRLSTVLEKFSCFFKT
jgi:hypothetical protein